MHLHVIYVSVRVQVGTNDQEPAVANSALAHLVENFSRQGCELIRRHMSLSEAGRRPSTKSTDPNRLESLARALLSSRGEASGVALATDWLAHYEAAPDDERQAFFHRLAIAFDPDESDLEAAWIRYRAVGPEALPTLSKAVESPRQELFRRINLAPNGTAALVRMREDLLTHLKAEPAVLSRVDADLVHLLQSWFNRGFLSMQAIDWSSPASLLERVIRYEAVHDIRDWDDLRRRLDPPDRRCYTFFHPALRQEPLIFVEVALTRNLSDNIHDILSPDRTPLPAGEATTAIFYSISNCQPGLRGISFGHFLIKQVARDLHQAMPNLVHFATLSPVPGFRAHLSRVAQGDPRLERIDEDSWRQDAALGEEMRQFLLPQAIAYLTEVRTGTDKPADPVARFHLGNGARLERINWRADMSTKGLRQSAGIMVNYVYDLDRIEENHEAYAHRGAVATGQPLRLLAERFARQAA